MLVHENVKNSVVEFIREFLRNKHFIEPEFFVGNKRIDVAFRNLKFLGEVEPNEIKKETEGKRQIKEYAEIVLRKVGYENVYGAVFWATDDKGDDWEVEIYEFSIEEGKLKEKFLGKGKEILKSLITSISEEPIPLNSQNFLLLFYPLKDLFYEKILAIYEEFKEHESVKPLIEAYKNALSIIYGKNVSEEKLKELFIIHTIIQLITNAILSYVLDGKIGSLDTLTGKYKRYSVALPFLEWLYILYEKKAIDDRLLKDFLNEVDKRILSLNWKYKIGDIFRLLYEAFISPEDRRTFGEYYTPLWLVKFMFDEVGNIKDIVVLDPFCGAGTFLDEALRRKIISGEEPSEAIRKVIGFDVNPIAVMLARAELLLTYRILTNREDFPTPLIFYVNSAEVFGREKNISGKLFTQNDKKKPVFLYQVKELTEVLNLSKLSLTFAKLEHISIFEPILRHILEEVHKAEKNKLGKLKSEIKRFSEKFKELSYLFNALNHEKLVELIEKFGDGVWSVSISSLLAISLVKKMKIGLAISNPPWIHLTEVKGDYGELLRSFAKDFLNKNDPSSAIIQAGNVASVFLKGFIDISEKSFFVLPESVVYDASTHGAGKILTYRAVEKLPHKIYRINYDAFKHGEKACLVLAGVGNSEIIEVKPAIPAGKDDESVPLDMKEMQETFRESINRVLEYFSQPQGSLEKALGVDKVYKKGSYIMGLFGGESKKGKEKYAGLVIEEIVESYPYRIRLYNTESFIELYEDEYLKNIITFPVVRPFFYKKLYILLSEKGEKDLKNFLLKISEEASPNDRQKIKKLIEELKQGKLLRLNPKKWYVVYRRIRTFVSFALQGNSEYVPDDSVSIIETSSKEKAYYYAGALNYLVSKVKKGFIRNQFARPLLALIKAGLEWRDEDWQYKVAELSEILHHKSESLFRNVNSKQVKKYLEILEKEKEWKELKKLFDKNVVNLEEAVKEVAES